MTPHLTVGLLADLKRREDVVLQELEHEFSELNRVLKKKGVEPHSEPEETPLWERETASLDLHCLRRLAANLDLQDELPEPGSEENVDDDGPTNRYYELAAGKKSFLARMLTPTPDVPRSFDHLIVHRDDDGFYLPIDFPTPIDYDSKNTGPGWIGSSVRLMAECEALAARLALPDAQGVNYERETACLELILEACRKTRETGAALILT